MVEVAAGTDELAQAVAAVAHQLPAAGGIGRDQLGNVAGMHAREDREQLRLECVRRGVRLEPEVALRCGDAQDRRPPAHVRLLDLAGLCDFALLEARVDPGARLG